tara:strand:+ start:142 stop:492 length:351 start_codon:yes stop_codon:yes gene_type:complete
MPISIRQLRELEDIDTITIHSLDPVLYQATVTLDGQEILISNNQGQPLRSFNLLEMQALFEDLPLKHLWLRHQSAYDEMVGQPVRTGSNDLKLALEKPSSTTRLAHNGLANRLGIQ